jgi:ribosomal-protein-alanine N-acetyltransferase
LIQKYEHISCSLFDLSILFLVVVYKELSNARRESFSFKGWPVEALIHDPETLSYFFEVVDKNSGCASLPRMVSDGIVICDKENLAQTLKNQAQQCIQSGPSLVTEMQLRNLRYGVTDLVDDLRDPRSSAELMATGAKLYGVLANYYFLSNGKWGADRKTIPRRLHEVNADFAIRYTQVFDHLFKDDDTEGVILLAEEILQKDGGFLFDGYESSAPAEWRILTWRPPVLKTKRLILRPLEERDAPAIFEYAKNPNVSKYTLWEPHQSLADSLSYIKDYAFTKYQQGIPEPWGIVLQDDPGKVIGSVGCFWSNKASKNMELAYAIGENQWGKGLVVEASRAVLDYVFGAFEVGRVEARCMVQNRASARVMEKLGMKFEGTLQSSLLWRNQRWDMHHYSILAGE